jgi:hypothetical protein
MLVAMRHKPITLMQFMRVMQNTLMIPLPTTSMRRPVPLNPRITLMTARHLMRMSRMIGRLRHVLLGRRSMRRHRRLSRSPLLEIHLATMMKTAFVLHDITSHRRRRRVHIRQRRPIAIPITNRPTHNLARCAHQHLLKPMQQIRNRRTLRSPRLTIRVRRVHRHHTSHRHRHHSIAKIFSAQIFFSTSVL